MKFDESFSKILSPERLFDSVFMGIVASRGGSSNPICGPRNEQRLIEDGSAQIVECQSPYTILQ